MEQKVLKKGSVYSIWLLDLSQTETSVEGQVFVQILLTSSLKYYFSLDQLHESMEQASVAPPVAEVNPMKALQEPIVVPILIV